jgi:protein TonB
MAYYGGAASSLDRAKAIGAVAVVHAALAAIILSGLSVSVVRQAVERIQTIDLREPPPPPPPEPPPQAAPKQQQAKLDEGAAGKKADPSPVVAPRPRLPVPAPIPAAPIAGTGNATTAGAANYGMGNGAGGSGNGRGGGGFDGFTPAQKITKIPDREYRQLAALSGMRQGTVGVSILVNPDGQASKCRVIRSSGSPQADGLMCQLTERYIRFLPARDAQGRPVPQDVIWYPNWWRP